MFLFTPFIIISTNSSSLGKRITIVFFNITEIEEVIVPILKTPELSREGYCSPNQICGGFTDLMIAVYDKNLDSVQRLLSNKNINVVNDKGWSALMIAARNAK